MDNTFWSNLWELDNQRAVLVRSLLRSRDWKYTSSTPGSYWMWRKEIDGVTYSVSEQDALRIQSILDDAEMYHG